MGNPFKTLTAKESVLWLISLLVVSISNILSGADILTFFAAVIGVTAVLFCSKGNIWGQIFIATFSLLYGIISWRFRYWGEMMTYVGMSFPMALWSLYTWKKNPSKENAEEVKIGRLKTKTKIIVGICSVAVTWGFYYILKLFDTPNLLFATLSVSTSFLAAALTMLRSSYYAFWYACNDLVLIVLWILASRVDIVYAPVAVNFMVFFINDLYGLYSWKRREKRQA